MGNYILRYKKHGGDIGYISQLELDDSFVHIRGTYEEWQREVFKKELLRLPKEKALEIASRDCLCDGWFIETQPANQVLEAININRIIQE